MLHGSTPCFLKFPLSSTHPLGSFCFFPRIMAKHTDPCSVPSSPGRSITPFPSPSPPLAPSLPVPHVPAALPLSPSNRHLSVLRSRQHTRFSRSLASKRLCADPNERKGVYFGLINIWYHVYLLPAGMGWYSIDASGTAMFKLLIIKLI